MSDRPEAGLARQTSLALIRNADYVVFGWVVEKKCQRGPKRERHGWVASLTIVVIALAAALARPASGGPKDDMTGVSKAEPSVTQDGTPAHPYADAGQCPSNTDLIIWPSGRSVPPGISVCFVGDQSFKDGDSGVQVRQH